jgi:hypothetical protein
MVYCDMTYVKQSLLRCSMMYFRSYVTLRMERELERKIVLYGH